MNGIVKASIKHHYDWELTGVALFLLQQCVRQTERMWEIGPWGQTVAPQLVLTLIYRLKKPNTHLYRAFKPTEEIMNTLGKFFLESTNTKAIESALHEAEYTLKQHLKYNISYI